jgi:predicted TIM-barrel fold metal-dependent hydrolase
MLLDINAYVGHWPFKQVKYNTCEALLNRMNQFGVEISIISNLNGIFYKNTQPANEELFEEMKSNKMYLDRFIPFAVINPIYAGWRNDLKVCIDKLDMKGVRLYPKYHDYELTDPACIELVKIVRDHGLPITFSFRMVDSRQRSWLDIEQEWDLKDIVPIIKEVPDAKYIFVNLCNSVKLSDEENALLKNADILFDTSGRSVNALPELLKRFGEKKFAFGTHSPILDYLTGLLRIESLREEEADEEMKEFMRAGNMKRFFGL